MPRMPNPLGSRWFRIVTPRPPLPQARTLAVDRGIRCLILDYDKMRGMDSDEYRLF